MAEIELKGVGKTYSDGTRAVSGLDLTVPDGELMVLVGPSGCGKTTTLMMVAGLEELTEGEIRIGGRLVNDVAPMDRDIAMVFQNYALYPHMSVYRNMAFGLRMRKLSKEETDRRVREAARILGLTDEQLEKKPKHLSGGQRQRVAMGRAIVRQPSAYLMDEPLSNLDAALRVEMRAEISRLQRDLGVTTLYVTHDQTEAMTLGDKVACFRGGFLQQVGPPQELYMRPSNLFVARFMGSPAMNLSEAVVGQADDGSVVMTVGSQVFAAPRHMPQFDAIKSRIGEKVVIGIRPEDIEDASLEPSDPKWRSLIDVQVNLVEAMGAETHVHFDIPSWSPPMVVEQITAETAEDSVAMAVVAGSNRLVARLSPRSHPRAGEHLRLSFDTAAMHVFDLGSGARVV